MNKLKVTGITCQVCNEFIWSAYVGETIYCDCGQLCITGGPWLTRVTADKGAVVPDLEEQEIETNWSVDKINFYTKIRERIK